MARRTSELVVKLRDQVSGPAGKAARSLRNLKNEAKGGVYGTRGVAGRGAGAAGVGALGLLSPGAVGAAGGVLGLNKMVKESLSFERALIQVQKATNATGAELQAYGQQILDMARATGKTKEEIAGVMAAAAFAGRPIQDLTRFTEYAAKAQSAWNMSAEETGQGLAEIGNIYQATQDRLQEIGDAINHVADNAAASEADLLEFLRRSGAVGKQMGFTAEQTIAFGAAQKEVGVRNEIAANTFNTLANALALGDEFLENSAKGYKALGLSGKQMQQAFRKDALGTAVNLLERIAKVADPIKRAEILTNLFGKEYQDNIAILANNLPGISKSLGLVANKAAYANSVLNNFGTQINTDVGRIDRATQAIDVLVTRAGNGFKILGGGIAESINELVESIEKGETILDKWRRMRDARDAAGGVTRADPADDPTLTRDSAEYWRKILFPSQGEISAAEREAREQGFRDRAGVSGRAASEIARSLNHYGGTSRFGRLSQRAVDGLRDEAQRNAASITTQMGGLNRFPWADPMAGHAEIVDRGIPHPLPPPRPRVDSSEIDAAKDKLTALEEPVNVNVNLAAVQALNAELRTSIGLIAQVNGGAANAAAGVSRAMGATAAARMRASHGDTEFAD